MGTLNEQLAMDDLNEPAPAASKADISLGKDDLQAISNLAWIVKNSRQNCGRRMFDAAEVVIRIVDRAKPPAPEPKSPKPAKTAAELTERALELTEEYSRAWEMQDAASFHQMPALNAAAQQWMASLLERLREIDAQLAQIPPTPTSETDS